MSSQAAVTFAFSPSASARYAYIAQSCELSSILPLQMQSSSQLQVVGMPLSRGCQIWCNGHEVQVNEALEDWRATISKFTAMMEDHAGIVHSLEASRSQYDSRQASWLSLLLALQG